MTDQPRLLAILAHPDDESFGPGGTLAKYARQGAQVSVCIVTDGAAGTLADSEPSIDAGRPLAQVRREELACACEILGVHLHTMSYRDSGMAGIADNQHPDSLYQADVDDVARALAHVIRQVRPHVIITHDPTGGYFHPDHVKVNQAVRRAWDVATDPVRGQQPDAPWRPARLYYTAIPRSSLRWLVRALRLLRRDPRHFGRNKDLDLTQVGVPAEQIHLRLDVGPFLSVKERAMACHKSQGGGGAASRLLPGVLWRRFLRYEHFVQALPPGTGPIDDLFQDLEWAA